MTAGKPQNRRKGCSFIEPALKELTDLGPVTAQRIGYQLGRVQDGLDPEDFKPRNDIGPGVMQISVNDENGKNSGRCFYVAKFNDRIYVLHCFEKKSKETPTHNNELGQARYKRLKEQLGIK